MKIALAQIHVRLGDFSAISERLREQAAVAASEGASLLCVPAALCSSMSPGTLPEHENYQHDLISMLSTFAKEIETLKLTCVVPAAIAPTGTPFVEFFVIREGRVVPARFLLAHRRENAAFGAWAPPVFDVDGVRVALSLDIYSDIDDLPRGCDLVVYFQAQGFDTSMRESTAVAAVPGGAYRDLASRASVWVACMTPLGGFDELVYTGGSFVMDDAGRVVAAAPCFEEALLVQEVKRGVLLSALSDHQLPTYRQEEWVWEALRLHLRDFIAAQGTPRVLLRLEGDLPSSALALLAVDALGARNVLGLLITSSAAVSRAIQETQEQRAQEVRKLARTLGIRLLERSVKSEGQTDGNHASPEGSSLLSEGVAALCVADTASALGAAPLASLTKTDYALAHTEHIESGILAPFGDIYMSALEFLVKERNRASCALPASLITLSETARCTQRIVEHALAHTAFDEGMETSARQLLGALEPAELDAILEAHIDRNLAFEDIPHVGIAPQAVQLVLLLVRKAELARRRLPIYPLISQRSFAERAWPMQLAWSDTGRKGRDLLSAQELVCAEEEREGEARTDEINQIHRELMGIIGSVLGLSSDQIAELQSPENQTKMQQEMEKLEGHLQGFFQQLMESGGQHIFGVSSRPFFSQN